MGQCKLCGKEIPRRNGYCLRCEREIRDGKAPASIETRALGGTVQAPGGTDSLAGSARNSQYKT